MTTTHLFVELLVIGFGAVAWLFLFGAAIFGYHPAGLDPRVVSWTTLFPLLSIVYVLGILLDRVADWIFEPFDARHREKYFGADKDAYFHARRTLVTKGPALWEHLEYGRSRLRICRGWAINFTLLLLAVDVFYLAQRPAALEPWYWKLAFCNMFLAFFSALSVACWHALNGKEYLKIKRQSVWIEKVNDISGDPGERKDHRAQEQV
jgi:hypothetical protein